MSTMPKHKRNRPYLDIHEVVDTNSPQLRELMAAFVQKAADGVALLALECRCHNNMYESEASPTITDFLWPFPSQ